MGIVSPTSRVDLVRPRDLTQNGIVLEHSSHTVVIIVVERSHIDGDAGMCLVSVSGRSRFESNHALSVSALLLNKPRSRLLTQPARHWSSRFPVCCEYKKEHNSLSCSSASLHSYQLLCLSASPFAFHVLPNPALCELILNYPLKQTCLRASPPSSSLVCHGTIPRW